MSACVFVCLFLRLFVLYGRPHCRTNDSETGREGGHRAAIGFSKISDPTHQPVPQIFAKKTPEFCQNSHCLTVSEWSREKSGYFRIMQHWDKIVLGWETCLGTPGAASFYSFSRFLSAAGEILAKQKLTSPLALVYKTFGGPTWTPGSHLSLTTSTSGEKNYKTKVVQWDWFGTRKFYFWPSWASGSHPTLTTWPGRTGGENFMKQKLFHDRFSMGNFIFGLVGFGVTANPDHQAREQRVKIL